MRSISELRTHTHLLGLGILCLSMPLTAVIASKLIFWNAIVAFFVVLCGKGQQNILKLVAQSRLTLVFLPILVWSGLSCLWSIDPWHSLLSAGRLLGVTVVFLILVASAHSLTSKETKILRIWLCRGGWLGLISAVLAVASIIGYSLWFAEWGLLQDRLNYFNRSAAVLVVLAWPICASFNQRWRAVGTTIFLLLAGMLCFALPSTALFVAYLFGLAMFGLATLSLSISRFALFFSFLAYVVLLPIISVISLDIIGLMKDHISIPIAEIHRIEVWKFCLTNITQNPLFGLGLDTSQKIPGGEEQVFLYMMPDGTNLTGPLMPLHPHSAPIQVWLELGLFGFLFSTVIFVFCVWSIPVRPSDKMESRAAIATVGSGFALAILSFDIWQGWWLCTLCSAGLYCTTILWRGDRDLDTSPT